jgi:hypothetical protein
MQAMGMRYLGCVVGAPHALVFQRVGALDLTRARRAERWSRVVGPLVNRGCKLKSFFWFSLHK